MTSDFGWYYADSQSFIDDNDIIMYSFVECSDDNEMRIPVFDVANNNKISADTLCLICLLFKVILIMYNVISEITAIMLTFPLS